MGRFLGLIFPFFFFFFANCFQETMTRNQYTFICHQSVETTEENPPTSSSTRCVCHPQYLLFSFYWFISSLASSCCSALPVWIWRFNSIICFIPSIGWMISISLCSYGVDEGHFRFFPIFVRFLLGNHDKNICLIHLSAQTKKKKKRLFIMRNGLLVIYFILFYLKKIHINSSPTHFYSNQISSS